MDESEYSHLELIEVSHDGHHWYRRRFCQPSEKRPGMPCCYIGEEESEVQLASLGSGAAQIWPFHRKMNKVPEDCAQRGLVYILLSRTNDVIAIFRTVQGAELFFTVDAKEKRQRCSKIVCWDLFLNNKVAECAVDQANYSISWSIYDMSAWERGNS